MKDIPMKNTAKYREPMSLKIEETTKRDLEYLKGLGVDTAQLCREAIGRAVNVAKSRFENLGKQV